MSILDYAALRDAVSGSAVAVRSITRLEPAGGPHDKVFPPTYVKEDRALTKYAMETRRIDGKDVSCVLLDSVQSQANRMEEALLEGWRRGDLKFPVVGVDFSKVEGLKDLEMITALQAPHRIADALLRDSTLEGKPFRFHAVGQAFSDARTNHATGMFKYCPTALVFGIWDSTGPKGGMGAKFQRSLVSEILGIDVVSGVKTASRIDPTGIEKKAGEIYQHKDPEKEWTVSKDEARLEKGKPVLFSRKGGGDKGTPASINHGNIPPSIDAATGGVTMAYAEQMMVLSLAGLRRLRFSTDCVGEAIPADKRDGAELAARTALAALGLSAVVYQRENGFDLRSRSLLVPTGPLVLELVGRDGGEPKRVELDRAQAAKLLADAESAARGYGLGWDAHAIQLDPAPKLAQLILESRKLKQLGDEEGEG
jgi:CRISPR-associated protein Csb1